MVGRSRTGRPGERSSRPDSVAVRSGERGYTVGEHGLVADEFDSAGGEGRARFEKAGEDVAESGSGVHDQVRCGVRAGATQIAPRAAVACAAAEPTLAS
jgi:hypothetical protein